MHTMSVQPVKSVIGRPLVPSIVLDEKSILISKIINGSFFLLLNSGVVSKDFKRVPSKNHISLLSKCVVSLKLDMIQDVILSENRRPAPRPKMKA